MCSVGRKEVGVGWGVGELIKRNRGSDIDLKINRCSLCGPVREVPMQPGM